MAKRYEELTISDDFMFGKDKMGRISFSIKDVFKPNKSG